MDDYVKKEDFDALVKKVTAIEKKKEKPAEVTKADLTSLKKELQELIDSQENSSEISVDEFNVMKETVNKLRSRMFPRP